LDFVEKIRNFSFDTKFDAERMGKIRVCGGIWGRTNLGFVEIREKIRIRASHLVNRLPTSCFAHKDSKETI